MERNYSEFKKLLESKLTMKSLSLAVLNEQGDIHYENFKDGVEKHAIIQVVHQTINTARETTLSSEFPEYMMYKGTDAFLLILPSRNEPRYYVVFCHNGLNVGMTRICVQNTIGSFENSEL